MSAKLYRVRKSASKHRVYYNVQQSYSLVHGLTAEEGYNRSVAPDPARGIYWITRLDYPTKEEAQRVADDLNAGRLRLMWNVPLQKRQLLPGTGECLPEGQIEEVN